MLSLLRTLRNNWKKTIFFAIVGYAGTDYATERLRTQNLMRQLALEAKTYGNGSLPSGARTKHVTVLLNPASGNRKGRDKFEKFAEPLLHLSGFLVNVVKTEQISEARQLVEILEKTNIIAVGGGDGTVMEVVTGLLRRDDAEEAVRRFPIGVIPLGKHNSFATSALDYDPTCPKKSIAQAALSISKHHIQPKDVIKVEIIGSPLTPSAEEPATEQETTRTDPEVKVEADEVKVEVDTPKKPYYLTTGFKLGDFCEAERREDEMPKFLYSKFRHFWSLLRTPSTKFKVEVRYRLYCAGCSNCKALWVKPENPGSFFTRIVSVFKPSVYAVKQDQDAKWNVTNSHCGKWDTLCVDATELNVLAQGNGMLEIQVGKNLSRTEFILQGFRRRDQNQHGTEFNLRVPCQEVEIYPITVPNSYYLDNEDFPVKPIRMEVLRNKVYFFRIPPPTG